MIHMAAAATGSHAVRRDRPKHQLKKSPPATHHGKKAKGCSCATRTGICPKRLSSADKSLGKITGARKIRQNTTSPYAAIQAAALIWVGDRRLSRKRFSGSLRARGT